MTLIVPTAALAGDGWSVEIDTKLEYQKTFYKNHFVQPGFSINTTSSLTKPDATLQAVPYINYGIGNFKMGPEVKLPLLGTKEYEFLLKVEGKLPQ